MNFLPGNVDRNVHSQETIMLITYHFGCLGTNHALTQIQEALKRLGLPSSALEIHILRGRASYFQRHAWCGKPRSAVWASETYSCNYEPLFSFDTQRNAWG